MAWRASPSLPCEATPPGEAGSAGLVWIPEVPQMSNRKEPTLTEPEREVRGHFAGYLPFPLDPPPGSGIALGTDGLVRNLSYFPEPAGGGHTRAVPDPRAKGERYALLHPSSRCPGVPPLIAVVIGLLIAIPSRAAVATAFVRVNQVGYPDSALKRAYLMASDVETGGSFAVKSRWHDRVLGVDRARPRLLEPGLSARLRPRLRIGGRARYLHDRGHRLDPGHVTVVPHRRPGRPIRDRARQFAFVLRERARRRRLRPVRPSYGAFAFER